MLLECYPGETLRLTAADLTHSDSGAVTSGATVTITILNPDGTQFATSSADNGGVGDDWFHDFTGPTTPGVYAVQFVAAKTGATAKARGTVRVLAF